MDQTESKICKQGKEDGKNGGAVIANKRRIKLYHEWIKSPYDEYNYDVHKMCQ